MYYKKYSTFTREHPATHTRETGVLDRTRARGGSAGEVVEADDAEYAAADFETDEPVGVLAAEDGHARDLLAHVLL